MHAAAAISNLLQERIITTTHVVSQQIGSIQSFKSQTGRSFDLGESNIDAGRKAYHLFMDVLRWKDRRGPISEYPCPHGYSALMDAFATSMIGMWTNRAFIMTEGGRIGAASSGVKVGDTICVLFGGRPAYVAQKKHEFGTWRFIGDAYIDDLMNGEIFEILEKGEVKQEMFAFD